MAERDVPPELYEAWTEHVLLTEGILAPMTAAEIADRDAEAVNDLLLIRGTIAEVQRARAELERGGDKGGMGWQPNKS